jgi:hypothetical protein
MLALSSHVPWTALDVVLVVCVLLVCVALFVLSVLMTCMAKVAARQGDRDVAIVFFLFSVASAGGCWLIAWSASQAFVP